MSEDKKYKILIIEDEALVARELKSRLTGMGYDVVGIAYGIEGIDLARQTSPDLLLTDIHLKAGQDGIEVAQQIRAERDIPVVFLTAYSDETTVGRAKSVAPYGYIIKPVENRELEIAIEIALYKHNIEKELKETQQLLQTALTCIGSALVFVDDEGNATDLNQDAQTLFAAQRAAVIGGPWWSLFSIHQDSSIARKVSTAISSKEVTKLAPFIVSGGQGSRLVDGIVGPMETGAVMIIRELSVINDPVESLPSPDEILAREGSERLGPSESSMCQLLIGAHPGAPVNDDAMERVSQLLNQMLRATDLVSAYGDDQFSVSMPYTSVKEGRQIAGSILSSLNSLDFDGESLNFSIGLSSTTPGDQQPFELFRRASWALNVARDTGGNRVIVWNDTSEQPAAQTSRQEARHREYHNLVLLWNVMNVVVKSADREELGQKLSRHLTQSFGFGKVAWLSSRAGAVAALAGTVSGSEHFRGTSELDLSSADLDHIREGLAGRAHVAWSNRHVFALSAEDVLYIETTEPIAEADVAFLQTLVTYISSGFSRPAAVAEGRDIAGEGELVFRSPRMHSILESVNLVAPTDATVLIVGESGTGKERLARRIHEVSPRADKPFVIVDCGAVVGSLIESELFGHVKGAFTGADRHASGRLKEAAGGTILLDEVGEMPLDVQVKLLRFVQEHEVAPVGGTRYESVDTRVIAATNRDLEALVAQGKFREDLYYRLNVFTIETPPLRDRDGDVLLLANHYLKRFARQYGKPVTGFTPDAERALVQQRWPGNIRELMNVINRAVILCRDSRVSNIHLGLFPESGRDLPEAPTPRERQSLESWLSQLVDQSLTATELPPLAQWLEEDVIAATLSISADVLNRAASTLGIPESTLRRKVARIRDSDERGRPRHNESLAPLMDDLVEMSRVRQLPVLDLVSDALIKEIESRRLNRKDAAALMGVSLPTYRKMLSDSP
ncbi:MAG: sigma 54-interacting transcriptional regulator [Pseudomonadales bacterium]|nr:sigma 54-interacting transcriptional regulator [Pseudomonadales bacterium]